VDDAGPAADLTRTAPEGVDETMPEEKQDIRQDDEVVDEMPDSGGAPCGDIFATPGAAAIVTPDTTSGAAEA
jgi:hypothetical protein